MPTWDNENELAEQGRAAMQRDNLADMAEKGRRAQSFDELNIEAPATPAATATAKAAGTAIPTAEAAAPEVGAAAEAAESALPVVGQVAGGVMAARWQVASRLPLPAAYRNTCPAAQGPEAAATRRAARPYWLRSTNFPG